MKTLKITEKVHKDLTELQSKIYNEQGIKMTYNQIINGLLGIAEQIRNEHK